MTDTKKQVPPSKPAGKNDKVEVVMVNMQQVIGERGEDQLKTPRSTNYKGITSDDLNFGVNIQAYRGGKEEVTKQKQAEIAGEDRE